MVKRGVAAAAVAALLLAACGGGGGKKKAANSSSATTETSTTVAGGTTTTAAGAAGGATATTAAKKTTATTSAAKVNGGSSSNYQPPAGSTPAKPATPGVYRYDTSGTSTFGTQTSKPPPVTTLTVDPPAGTRQHSTRDDRDASGNGSVTETTLDYQPQGVFIVELKIVTKALGITDTEDLVANPPALAAPTGVKPGQSVEFDLTGANGTNESVHVKIDFVRNERLTIGGQPVDTILTHQVATLSGKITGTTTSDSWASQQYSLFVKDHTVSDVTAYGAKAHSDITSQLQKVTPG